MLRSIFSKIVILIIIGITIGIGLATWISSLPRISGDLPEEEITADLGEQIFWEKGNCHICHRIGDRGEALRGPNLGQGKDGSVISQRARQRAKDAGLTSPVNYITQSVTLPTAYVVPGYSSEMPEVYKPPISLTPGEIKAVIKYLASLGGEPEPTGIQLPAEVFDWWQTPQDTLMRIAGDTEKGRRLFFDNEGPAACASCHLATSANGESDGRLIGPDLRNVAAIRTAAQLYRKLVQSGEKVVSGYEKVLVRTGSGLLFAGVMEAQDSTTVSLRLDSKELREIRKEHISQIVPQGISAMPSNYGDLLNNEEMQDLLAYLLTLQ